MGVTIHFEGKLKSAEDFDQLLTVASEFAESNHMPYAFFAEEKKSLQRVLNEEDWDYEGPVKGIKIQPDDNVDPLWLEFDENLYAQDFCKTQFAESGVHILIVQLLEQLQTFFVQLTVFDEGEYWDTHNVDKLVNHFNWCFKALEKRLKELPKVSGPHKMEDGRIIDLMGE